ncbi:MAG: DinB family protein [Planctomycetota bacterium]
MSTTTTVSGSLTAERQNVINHFDPLREVLGQLRRLVRELNVDQYNLKPVTTYSGSLGGHVRHCLDHAKALLNGINGGLVDYEARERGNTVETDPVVAHRELERIEAELAALSPEVADREVTTSFLLTPAGPPLRAESTVTREIAFVLSHTIHHNAMIGGMAKAVGAVVPGDFGMAPGTLKHDQAAKAS